MQTIESPHQSIDRTAQQPTLDRRRLSLGCRLDSAIIGALVGPPAMIGLLTLLGVGFALAVCVAFAVVFVVTTAEDATWMWQRRIDREIQSDPH